MILRSSKEISAGSGDIGGELDGLILVLGLTIVLIGSKMGIGLPSRYVTGIKNCWN